MLFFLLDSPRFHSPSSYPVSLAPDEVTVPRAEGPRPGRWTEGREQQSHVSMPWAGELSRWSGGRRGQHPGDSHKATALLMTVWP